MQDIMSQVQAWIALYGLKVIAAILIFVIGRWVAQLLRKIIRALMERHKVDPTLVSFVTHLAYVAMLTFVVIAAIGKLGIQTASFIAVIGAAGLAIGLALQGSLANFAAGVLMLIFKPFKVGDFIDAAGTMGIVEEIEIFTTTLKTPDNKLIIVPNAKITGDNITNFTARDTRRMDLVVGVSYGDNLAKVKEVLNDVLSQESRLLEDPAPTIGVLEMADSSVNFAVRPWVKTSEYWDVFFDLNQKIKERLDAEGISIPFPQRDVHLYNHET